MQEGSNNAMSPETMPKAIFRFLDLRGGGKTLRHHVLQPKSSIYRVRHVLAKARRTRTNVQDQDNDSDSSMHFRSI